MKGLSGADAIKESQILNTPGQRMSRFPDPESLYHQGFILFFAVTDLKKKLFSTFFEDEVERDIGRFWKFYYT